MDRAEKDAILAAQQFEMAEVRRHEDRAGIFLAVALFALISAILGYWAVYIPLGKPIGVQLATYVLFGITFIFASKWRREVVAAREIVTWLMRDRYEMLKEKLEREVDD